VNGRARLKDAQGLRAGIASRMLADLVDFLTIIALIWLILMAVSAVRFLFDGEFTMPDPGSPYLSTTLGLALATVYLAYGWSTAGRTIGKQVMGLRVMRRGGGRLGPGLALARAVFCLLVMPGLLLAAFSRRNASLQDLMLGTVVIYDEGEPGTRRSLTRSGGPPG
jgi:uncharacterized RDD family membrane protein YckC